MLDQSQIDAFNRDGVIVVGRKVTGWGLAEHPNAICVRVTGLPGRVGAQAVDISWTLRKEGLPSTVDGLRKAVLKEFPNALKDKDISDLDVFPASAKQGDDAFGPGSPVGSHLTAIVPAPPEEPYHVVVNSAHRRADN